MAEDGGTKHDTGKPRLDLIPPTTIWALGKVFEYGARKYDDRNWELGITYGRLFQAMQRHLWAFWQGEEEDPESGLPHLYHALAELSMLLDTHERKLAEDDRPDYSNLVSPYLEGQQE